MQVIVPQCSERQLHVNRDGIPLSDRHKKPTPTETQVRFYKSGSICGLDPSLRLPMTSRLPARFRVVESSQSLVEGGKFWNGKEFQQNTAQEPKGYFFISGTQLYLKAIPQEYKKNKKFCKLLCVLLCEFYHFKAVNVFSNLSYGNLTTCENILILEAYTNRCFVSRIPFNGMELLRIFIQRLKIPGIELNTGFRNSSSEFSLIWYHQ